MYQLPKDIRDALINYLAHRPYGEVNQLIDVLVRLKMIEQSEPSDTDKA